MHDACQSGYQVGWPGKMAKFFWLRLSEENKPAHQADIYHPTILTLELKIANHGKHVADFINGQPGSPSLCFVLFTAFWDSFDWENRW